MGTVSNEMVRYFRVLGSPATLPGMPA
jgi:hypothetical protein